MRVEPHSHAAPWPRAAIAWVFLACLGLFLYSLGIYHRLVLEVNPAILPSANWTPEGFRRGLELAGESLDLYAAFQVGFISLLALGYLGISALLLLRKPQDRMARIVALSLVVFGTGFPPPIQALKVVFPAYAVWVDLWTSLGYAAFFLLFYTFPDGRFTPSWTRWLGLFWVGALLSGAFFPGTPLDVLNYPEPWSTLIALILFASFIGAQIFRFRRVSNPLQRQQTKWVVAGMVSATIFFVATWSTVYVAPSLDQPGLPGIIYQHVVLATMTGGFLLIPLSIGIAILRHRLWDIDVLIRRTLVYVLLSAILVLLYFSGVTLFQWLFTSLSGQRSPASIVISTLGIAVLFNPLRRRLQEAIDRRFYRQKYDAALALEEFSAAARSEVDVTNLTGRVLTVVRKTVQPEQVSVWLRNVKPD